MRNRFAAEIEHLAEHDERIVLLSGDIGNRLFNRFRKRFPQRFYNCGVAEANMIGVAAGLAASGLRPVAYTIAPFLTTRALEQIKIDLCYHSLPVVLIGVGAGLSYASLGPTHHTLDDIAQLRSLPGLTILAPGDAHEVAATVRAGLAGTGPVYIRIGKKNEPRVHECTPEFEVGTSFRLREGRDVCLLATGTVLPEALHAVELLSAAGIDAELHSVPTIAPLDAAWIAGLAQRFDRIVTVEEHALAGGFGAAVLEALHEAMHESNAQLPDVVRVAAPDRFHHGGGTTAEAREALGLDARAIAARVVAAPTT